MELTVVQGRPFYEGVLKESFDVVIRKYKLEYCNVYNLSRRTEVFIAIYSERKDIQYLILHKSFT